MVIKSNQNEIIMDQDQNNEQDQTNEQDLNNEQDQNIQDHICRVCHAPIDPIADLDQLLSPCRCIGSMAYIHRECFENMNRDRCEICRFYYIAGRVPNPEPQNPFAHQFEFDFNPQNLGEQMHRINNMFAAILPEQDPNTRFPIRQLYHRLGTSIVNYSLNVHSSWKLQWHLASTYIWILYQLADIRNHMLIKRLFKVLFFNLFLTVLTIVSFPSMYLGSLINSNLKIIGFIIAIQFGVLIHQYPEIFGSFFQQLSSFNLYSV